MLLLALLVAGCGGEGEQEAAPLPAGVASELATRSDAVAAKLDAGDPCGARADADSLQQETIAAINAGRVPPRYQEELTAAVGALAASISCTSTPPTTPDPAARSGEHDDDDEDDKDRDDDRDDDGDRDRDDDDGEDGKEKKGKGEGKGKGKEGKRG